MPGGAAAAAVPVGGPLYADAVQVLTRRQLNRSLLERNLLLERSGAGVVEAVEHLLGLQAQEPQEPYLGLAARLEGFDPSEASDLLDSRHLVRILMMRRTVHLLSARDAWGCARCTTPCCGSGCAGRSDASCPGSTRTSWPRPVGHCSPSSRWASPRPPAASPTGGRTWRRACWVMPSARCSPSCRCRPGGCGGSAAPPGAPRSTSGWAPSRPPPGRRVRSRSRRSCCGTCGRSGRPRPPTSGPGPGWPGCRRCSRRSLPTCAPTATSGAAAVGPPPGHASPSRVDRLRPGSCRPSTTPCSATTTAPGWWPTSTGASAWPGCGPCSSTAGSPAPGPTSGAATSRC